MASGFVGGAQVKAQAADFSAVVAGREFVEPNDKSRCPACHSLCRHQIQGYCLSKLTFEHMVQLLAQVVEVDFSPLRRRDINRYLSEIAEA